MNERTVASSNCTKQLVEGNGEKSKLSSGEAHDKQQELLMNFVK